MPTEPRPCSLTGVVRQQAVIAGGAPLTLRTTSLLTSVITALAAWLGFGTIHALWIVPIWSRLASGLPFALVGAAACGWAFAELRLAGALSQTPVQAGLRFGAGAWVALLPATLLSAGLRLAQWHDPEASWPTVLEVATAVATGAAMGRQVSRSWRAALACAAAAGVLLAVQAGPVPVVNSFRAAGLALLLLGLYVAAGVLQAWVVAYIEARQGQPRASVV